MTNEFDLSFTLDLDDYKELCRQANNRSLHRKYFWPGLICFCVLVLLVGVVLESVLIRYIGLGELSAFLLFWAIWKTTFQPRRLRNDFENQMAGRATMSVNVSEAEIRYKNPVGQGSFVWQTIRDGSESSEHFILWLSRFQGFIIPKRSFVNEDMVTAFAELAIRKGALKARNTQGRKLTYFDHR